MRKSIIMLLMAAATTFASQAVTVNNTAGSLSNKVTDVEISELTVTGTIDARDFLFITNQLEDLVTVDLSNVTVVPYDEGKVLYGTVTTYGNEIPRTAFFGKTKLASITLPATLQSIGMGAFAGCTSLTQITIPATVVSIGNYAFSGSGLTSITLPATVLDMGKGVFSRCESLTSAEVNAAYLGEFAFLGDIKLANVTLSENVRTIYDGAFNGCTALTTVNIPENSALTRIASEAFIASGLQNITVGATGLGTVGDWAFAQTPLTGIELPSGMTELGEGAFAHDYELEYVSMPGVGHASSNNGRGGGVTPRHIGAYSAPLETINDYTFASDTKLAIGDMLINGVGNIGAYAFYNNSQAVDTMRLPESVSYLGDYAMAGMIGMATLKTDNPMVPALGNEVWAGVNQSAVPLITPDGTQSQYQAAEQWMEFFFQQTYVLGDVNGDGNVDITDVTVLIDYLLGSYSGTFIAEAADVNPDGDVNISDVTALIDLLLGGTATKTVSGIRDIIVDKYIPTDDALKIEKVTLNAGQTTMVNVALNNNEHDYAALECQVVLPKGVVLDGVSGVERGSHHDFYTIKHEAEDNVYTIIGVSTRMNRYAGDEGNVLSLKLSAASDFDGSDAELTLANVMLVTPKHEVYLASDVMAQVNENTSIEDVTNGKQVAAVRYINVAGQESDQPFDGMNIVVTIYTDGTTSTAKVLR